MNSSNLSSPFTAGVQRVCDTLKQHGNSAEPVMLKDAARTAQEAADALGVELGQIAKSIIFRRVADDMAVLVVTSGDRRVDQRKVERQVGELARADAAFVKEKTGFSIGGVAPVGHVSECLTLIDADLFRFDTIWAAAGHPHAVFALRPDDLCQLTGEIESDVVESPLPDMPAGARTLLGQRVVSVQASNSHSMSPCLSVCRMHETTGYCLGCLRTMDELMTWAASDLTTKRTVWNSIAKRLQGSLL
jgi:prolyl-tRNA editing enzyme YbaK/EbsC (Cys-tRNA(Pro) deacylase)/predicted Fe-S protein YdhL (DUF1289 family)